MEGRESQSSTNINISINKNHPTIMPRRQRPAQQTDGHTPSAAPAPDAQAVARLAAYIENEKPSVKTDELDQIVGPEQPTFSNEWSQADEDELCGEWEPSDEKLCLARLPSSLLPPWKVAMRIFRSTPVGIISPLQNLVYQPLPATGRTQTSPIYSEPFSKRLSALMAHPFWEGEVVKLILALQYAVICRFDDRRHWQVPGFCGALEALKATMDASAPNMPQAIHEMHVEARSTTAPARPSAMSDFLEHVGNVVKATRFPVIPSAEMEYKGVPVYPVNLKDLDVLTEALDTHSQQGLPVICSVSVAFRAYREASSQRDMPSANQLAGFYERTVLYHRRLITQMKRRGDTSHELGAVSRCMASLEATAPSTSSPTVRRIVSPIVPVTTGVDNSSFAREVREFLSEMRAEMTAVKEEVRGIKVALEKICPQRGRQQPSESPDFLDDSFPRPHSQRREEQLGQETSGEFDEPTLVRGFLEGGVTDLGRASRDWEDPPQPRPKATAEHEFTLGMHTRRRGKGLGRIDAEDSLGL